MLSRIVVVMLARTTFAFKTEDQILRSLVSLSPHDPKFVTKFLNLRNFKSVTAVPKPLPLSMTDKKLTRLLQDHKETDKNKNHLREAYGYILHFFSTKTDTTNKSKLNDYGQLKTDSNALWHKITTKHRELTSDSDINM